MSAHQLAAKKCSACDSSVPPLTPGRVEELAPQVPAWVVSEDRRHLCRHWIMRDFAAALEFFNRVGQIAEEEGHHPDLHLTMFRDVRIQLSTHAVGGLTENDFILASKIDRLSANEKL